MSAHLGQSKRKANAKSFMPCGIIPSGRAPKSIVVPLTCTGHPRPIAGKGEEPTVLYVLPKHDNHRNSRRACSCPTTVYVNLSMNSFLIAPKELRSRKRMQRYTLFHFLQNIHKKNIHFNPTFNILKHFLRSKTPLHIIHIN